MRVASGSTSASIRTLIHSANICVVPNLLHALFQALGRVENKIRP